MENKPFWKSRKFGYALGTLLATLLLQLLANIEGVSPEVQQALADFLPTVLVMGVLLITGHTITDVVALWKEGVAAKDLRDALVDLLDTLFEEIDGEDPEPGQAAEAAPGEIPG